MIEAQRFLYEVLEESADGIRATGLMLVEASEEIEWNEEQIQKQFLEQLDEVESGNYDSDVSAPKDHQGYDPTSSLSRGEEMNRWAEQYYGDELEGEG